MVEADGVVSQCDCSLGDPRGQATATLVGLRPGVTYQVAVGPRDGAYPLVPVRASGLLAGMGSREESGEAVAAKWGRMLGVELKEKAKLARVTAVTSDK